MARIAGVNLPTGKRIDIALTSIFGIGHTISAKICEKAGIDVTTRVHKLTEVDFSKIRDIIDGDHNVEGDLRQIGRAHV